MHSGLQLSISRMPLQMPSQKAYDRHVQRGACECSKCGKTSALCYVWLLSSASPSRSGASCKTLTFYMQATAKAGSVSADSSAPCCAAHQLKEDQSAAPERQRAGHCRLIAKPAGGRQQDHSTPFGAVLSSSNLLHALSYSHVAYMLNCRG